VVSRHKEAFVKLLQDYVDLVFCNEAEASTMTDQTDPDKMIGVLQQWVPHVVLTLGKKGSKIMLDGTLYHVDAVTVEALDTTGAGDSFAAGYLFGLTQGYEIAAAGRLANFVEKATQATLIGDVFDDAATGQGLLNFFARAINSGAITEEEAAFRTGVTPEELRARSFLTILANRRRG